MNSRISAGSTVVDCRFCQPISPLLNVRKKNREKSETESLRPLDNQRAISTFQLSDPAPRDAWFATRARWPGSLLRMVRLHFSVNKIYPTQARATAPMIHALTAARRSDRIRNGLTISRVSNAAMNDHSIGCSQCSQKARRRTEMC